MFPVAQGRPIEYTACSVSILAQGNGFSRAPPSLGAGQSFALGHSLVEPFGSTGGWLRALAPSAASLLAVPRPDVRHGLGLRLLLALRAGLTRQKMCGKN